MSIDYNVQLQWSKDKTAWSRPLLLKFHTKNPDRWAKRQKIMKYKVKRIETLSKVVEIEAENEEEALSDAECNYDTSEDEYVLTSEDYEGVKFEIVIE